MEPCVSRIFELFTWRREITAEASSDPCGVYTTGGRICGLHNCHRPIRTIFLHGLTGKTCQLQMHKPLLSTIKDLKLCIKARMGIPVQHQRLLFGNRELDKDWGVLKDFGIEDKSTVILVARLPGGSVQRPSSASRRYTGNEAGIMYTNEPDCITGDSSIGVLRGRMSCGHSVDPGSLLRYGVSQMEEGNFVLLCPAIVNEQPLTMCRKEWFYPEFRKMALLTAYERQFFEEAMGENTASALLDAKVCPECSSLVERSNTENNRVVCLVCSIRATMRRSTFISHENMAGGRSTLYAFCFKCIRPWRGPPSGGKYCGNSDCVWDLVELLDDVPTKELAECPRVPKIRACPICGLLVEHLAGPRHVRCQRCLSHFCFVCLRLKCGSAKACTVAVRQRTMAPPLQFPDVR